VFLEINHSSTVPVYQQLKDQIKRSISSGLLPAESKVPSVRDVALHLRINPNTVAKAYRELELEGVLFTRKGQGTFVSRIQPTVSHQERVHKVVLMIDALLLSALQLGLAREEIASLVMERIEARRQAEEQNVGVGRNL